MSSGSSQRRKEPRAPLFEVEEKPLPKHPRPIDNLVDPFEDLPAVGPRAARRTAPEPRTPAPRMPEPAPAPASAKSAAAPAETGATVVDQAAPAQPAANTKPPLARPQPAAPPIVNTTTTSLRQEPAKQPVPKQAQFPYQEPAKQPVVKKAAFPYQALPEPLASKTKVPFQRQEQFERTLDNRLAFDRSSSNRQPIYDDSHQHWDAPMQLARRRPGLLLLLAFIVCAGIVWWWASADTKTFISLYKGEHMPASSDTVIKSNIPSNTPPGQHSVLGQPTISAAGIDAVLAEYGSPAAGTGQAWVAIGERYGINPAYALAFFIHESSAGTNPGWAGLKGDGTNTHNVGNIICAGYPTCYGRFRDYPGWEEGIDDWYKLIGNEYINGRSASTIEQIIPIYAPSSDNNDVPAYVQSVVNMVDSWR